MSFQSLFKTKTILGVALTVLALVAFNRNQLSVNTEALSSFGQWYQDTASKLSPGAELREGNLPLRITITLNDPSSSAPSTVWELPKRSLLELDERDNTLRILGLINESGVFGLRRLPNPSKEMGYLSIAIKDEQRDFVSAVPLSVVNDNIQLRNLLQLLQVTSTEQSAGDVAPERL
jgi:hypothetical protein